MPAPFDASDSIPPPMPAPARFVALALGSCVLVSNGAGAVFALRASPEPFWGWLGFEIVMAVASVFGVLLGLGKFREGSGIAAACVAGAWFVGTGMGRLQTHAAPSQVLSDPWFLARFATAALFAASGAYAVLVRQPRSFRKLAAGGVMLLVVVGVCGFWLKTGGMWLGTPQPGAMDIARMGALSLLVIGSGVLFCIGSHLVIAAFQMGVPAGQPGSLQPAKGVQAPGKSGGPKATPG
jgi:hypothetical protein